MRVNCLKSAYFSCNRPAPPPDVKDPVVVKDDVIYLKAMGYGRKRHR